MDQVKGKIDNSVHKLNDFICALLAAKTTYSLRSRVTYAGNYEVNKLGKLIIVDETGKE